MKLTKKMLWSMVAAMAITGGSYFGASEFARSVVWADSPALTAKPTPAPQPETVAPAGDLSRAFREVHNAMKDSVVNIQIKKKVSLARMHQGMQLPQEFAPDDLTPNEGEGPSSEMMGTGSGVIVSPDGYVLTNNHVVDGADDISVRLDDGRTLKAKVVGLDPKTDLAVVKINADHLTYAKFGDSDAIDVGDWVLAFGSPFGFDQTMTQGIISAKGRHIGIIESHNPSLKQMTYENFLQTDAAINPGNSGGPLVNLKGEVVGINSAIASNTGAYNGIGFSIPSNDANYIMDSLIKHGKVIRGFLNVKIEDLDTPIPQDQTLADSIRQKGFKGKGSLVGKVDPEGPAGKGGVKAGDVVTALNGKPMDSVEQFRNTIARTPPNSEVKLSIYRDGKTIELAFPLGTQPDVMPRIAEAADQSVNDLGIKIQTLDESSAQKYRFRKAHGVVVTELDPNGLAAQSGLGAGDVITSINGTEVNSGQDFSDAMTKAKLSEGVRLTVRTMQGMDRLLFIEKK